MKSFSTSQKDRAIFSKEDLRRIDVLLKNQKRIDNEEELATFISSLSTDLEKYKTRIESYLRTRDTIDYHNMNMFQAMALYSSLRDELTDRAIEDFDKFFNTEVDDVPEPVKLLEHLLAVTIKRPNSLQYKLFCTSLMNYIEETISFGDEEPPLQPLQAESNDTLDVAESTVTITEEEVVNLRIAGNGTNGLSGSEDSP